MEKWIIFTFLYAVFNGIFQCAKKKSIEKNTIYEVLAYFSTIAFLIVACTCKNVFKIELSYILTILFKSIIIIAAWILSLYSMSKMSVSMFSIIHLSRIIFSVILSVLLLGENLTVSAIIGLFIVILGLVLVNKDSDKSDYKETSFKVIGILLISSLLSSLSAIIDKKVLVNITSMQMQFWFMLFLSLGYWLILFLRKKNVEENKIKRNIKNEKIQKNKKTNKKINYWILITAICLAVGDRFLFMANEIPESKASIITIIQQISTIEIILLGKVLFKEKNIIRKLLCSILIIFGIALTLI